MLVNCLCFTVVVIILVTNIYGTLTKFQTQCQALFNIQKYFECPETPENTTPIQCGLNKYWTSCHSCFKLFWRIELRLNILHALPQILSKRPRWGRYMYYLLSSVFPFRGILYSSLCPPTFMDCTKDSLGFWLLADFHQEGASRGDWRQGGG